MASKSGARADKLKKLPMPKKPMSEQEADFDLEMLASESEMPAEDMEMKDASGFVGPLSEEEGPALNMLSDDELLAELKKRGLMSESSPVGKAAEADLMSPEMEAPEAEEEEEEEVEIELPAKKLPKKFGQSKK